MGALVDNLAGLLSLGEKLATVKGEAERNALPLLHNPGVRRPLEPDEPDHARRQCHQPRLIEPEARAVGSKQLQRLDLVSVCGQIGEV